MRRLHALLFITLLVAASACKKDSSNEPEIDPKVRQLARSWKTETFTINPPLPVENNTGAVITLTDLYALFGTCEKDNIYSFNADPKTYTQEAGAIRCTGQGKVIEAGTWFFSGDKQTIVLDVAGSLENWDILELTDTQLRVSYAVAITINEQGDRRNFTITRTFSATQ